MVRLKLVALTISRYQKKNKAEHQIGIRSDIILAKGPLYFCSWSATFNSCITLIRSVLSMLYGRSFLELTFIIMMSIIIIIISVSTLTVFKKYN